MRDRHKSLLAHLLGLVTWPHWTHDWMRTVLTVVGVALGVSTIVAVADISASILGSFQHMVSTVAGASELEIHAPAGTVDEDAVRVAAALPGVAAAGGLVEASLPLADHPDETAYLLGVDFLDSTVWRSQLPRAEIDIPDTLEFVAHSDSVVVTRAFAARHGLALDGALTVIAPTGPATLRIRGLLGDVPAARLLDGGIMLMDLPPAQTLLGRQGTLDRVAVTLAPGSAIADVRARLATAVAPRHLVSPPEARGEQAEKLLFCLRSMLIVAGSLAVIVGAIIAYQAVAVSVQQRRRQFALLNAVGISRRTLLYLCLTETGLLALIGATLGVIAGHGLAFATTRLVGIAASEMWLALDVHETLHSWSGATLGVGVGLAMALLAADVAVRTTFDASTVEALRPAAIGFERSVRRLRAIGIATLLVGATWAIWLISPDRPWMVVAAIIGSQLIAYVGVAIVSPTLVVTIGNVLQRLTSRSYSLPARLAAENMPRTPRRSGMTVTMIAAAIGMTASLGGFVRSFEAGWLGWIGNHFSADLFIGSGARIHLLAGPSMEGAVREIVAAIPGVATVEPFRVLPMQFDDRPVFLQAISVDDRLRHGGLAMVEGSLAAAATGLRNGTGLLLSDNLAFRLGRHRGDVLALPTPAGARTYRIEGTFVDYLGSLDRGSVVVSTEHLAALWNDRAANLLRVWLDDGTATSDARRAIVTALGPGYYVVSAREFLGSVRVALDRLFMITWGLVVVAMLISVIGVVNAQLATVIDRRREIAMLRTIGVSGRDLTRAVVLECGVLGTIGALSGLALGSMLSGQFVIVSMRLLTGWRLPFVLPVLPLLGAVILAAVVSSLAGYIPARTAGRLATGHHSPD